MNPSALAQPIQPRPMTLRVHRLSVHYGGVAANDDISLVVAPGEIHGLIGPNGAGKSTLIDAITGFVNPSGGSVFLDDVDVSSWKPHRRSRRGLGRSFQHVELCNDLSVAENLALGCDQAARRQYLTDLVWPGALRLSDAALWAVRDFNLQEDLQITPQSVSFGRRRLIAIARAVAAAPSILLLDEPAAGLDDQEARELGRLLQELARNWGIGILLVEHNLDMVLECSDKVTVLATGKVLFEGSPEDVRTDSDVVQAYLGGDGDANLDKSLPNHVVGHLATSSKSEI